MNQIGEMEASLWHFFNGRNLHLRLKLEENNEKRLIHTVRGVGYALRERSQ